MKSKNTNVEQYDILLCSRFNLAGHETFEFDVNEPIHERLLFEISLTLRLRLTANAHRSKCASVPAKCMCESCFSIKLKDIVRM